MTEKEQQLKDLSEIRSLMERSSRFISLSGLSGIAAGTWALIGAGIAHLKVAEFILFAQQSSTTIAEIINEQYDLMRSLILLGLGVLVAAVGTGVLFTTRKAKNNGQKIWDSTSKRLLINMFIPLAAGGLFCGVLVYLSIFDPRFSAAYLLVPGATMIFYGLGLINASKYTLTDIRYLGILQIALGLINMFYLGYGLYFWAFGFGILHIVYGTIMYFKYER